MFEFKKQNHYQGSVTWLIYRLGIIVNPLKIVSILNLLGCYELSETGNIYGKFGTCITKSVVVKVRDFIT